MSSTPLVPDSPSYPAALRDPSAPFAFQALDVIGDPSLLDQHLLALVTSVRCPGDAIIRLYDVIRELRDAGVPMIGGFHSPMEKECLNLLLRGRQPIVVCPARSIGAMRVPNAWRPAIGRGQLLIVSAFDARRPRVTATLAMERNRLVYALSSGILAGHVEVGGLVERLLQEAATSGRTVYGTTAEPSLRIGNVVLTPVSHCLGRSPSK